MCQLSQTEFMYEYYNINKIFVNESKKYTYRQLKNLILQVICQDW